MGDTKKKRGPKKRLKDNEKQTVLKTSCSARHWATLEELAAQGLYNQDSGDPVSNWLRGQLLWWKSLEDAGEPLESKNPEVWEKALEGKAERRPIYLSKAQESQLMHFADKLGVPDNQTGRRRGQFLRYIAEEIIQAKEEFLSKENP